MSLHTPRTNVQLVVESATIAAACTTTQPYAEDPGDLIVQFMMPEPNLPRMPEPSHPKGTGPIPRVILTDNPGSTAGSDRAAPLAEAGIPTVATAQAH